MSEENSSGIYMERSYKNIWERNSRSNKIDKRNDDVYGFCVNHVL